MWKDRPRAAMWKEGPGWKGITDITNQTNGRGGKPRQDLATRPHPSANLEYNKAEKGSPI